MEEEGKITQEQIDDCKKEYPEIFSSFEGKLYDRQIAEAIIGFEKQDRKDLYFTLVTLTYELAALLAVSATLGIMTSGMDGDLRDMNLFKKKDTPKA